MFDQYAHSYITIAVVWLSLFSVQSSAQTIDEQLETNVEICFDSDIFSLSEPLNWFREEVVSISTSDQIGLERGMEIAACLTRLQENPWAYDPLRNRVSTGMRYSQATEALAIELASHAAAALEAQRLAEDMRSLAAEARLAERRAEVINATIDACRELYFGDEVAALTNPICQPIFMQVGLPE